MSLILLLGSFDSLGRESWNSFGTWACWTVGALADQACLMLPTFSTVRWASARLSFHCYLLEWLVWLGWSYFRRSQVGSLSPVSLYSNELHLRSLAFLRKLVALSAILIQSSCHVEYAGMIYLLIGSNESLVRVTYRSASSCLIMRHDHQRLKTSWQVLEVWQRRSMGFHHSFIDATANFRSSCHLRWLKVS